MIKLPIKYMQCMHYVKTGFLYLMFIFIRNLFSNEFDFYFINYYNNCSHHFMQQFLEAYNYNCLVIFSTNYTSISLEYQNNRF